MKLYKKVCSCGLSWLSDSEEDMDCPNDDAEIHETKNSTKLSADDYAEAGGNELENANRHDITEMPNQILGVLQKEIKDKKIIKKIMKSLYEKEIGI